MASLQQTRELKRKKQTDLWLRRKNFRKREKKKETSLQTSIKASSDAHVCQLLSAFKKSGQLLAHFSH